MNFDQYTSDQLAEWRGALRMVIAQLEERKHLLNAEEQQTLKNSRSLMKALTREIRLRFVQPKLF